MRRYLLPSLAAALWLIASGIALAQPAPAYDESAQQNVRESEQYQQLVCTNAAFRASRMAKECGPLQGSPLYASCMASFNCDGGEGVQLRRPPPSERIR